MDALFLDCVFKNWQQLCCCFVLRLCFFICTDESLCGWLLISFSGEDRWFLEEVLLLFLHRWVTSKELAFYLHAGPASLVGNINLNVSYA